MIIINGKKSFPGNDEIRTLDLLDRPFNQLGHGARDIGTYCIYKTVLNVQESTFFECQRTSFQVMKCGNSICTVQQ